MFIWFALAPIPLEAPAVHAPGHLMIAACFTAAGLAYVSLTRHTHLLGAAVVGAAMIVLAGANASWAFGPQDSIGLSDRATFLNLALYLAMALGMQLMTFEDMTYELRVDQPASRVGTGRAARAGHQGCADRLPQPAILRRGDRQGNPAAPPLRDPAVAAVHRREPLQGHQRHARARGGRPRAPARRRFLSATSAKPTTSSAGAATSFSS